MNKHTEPDYEKRSMIRLINEIANMIDETWEIVEAGGYKSLAGEMRQLRARAVILLNSTNYELENE